MSNRDVQPICFACLYCGEKIEIEITNEDINFKGVVTTPCETLFNGTNRFVDLHLDFPVSFEKYVSGNTPFMSALKRINAENYLFHAFRLNCLNHLYKKVDCLKRVIRAYLKNSDLFGRLCKRDFDIEPKSMEAKDINAALYIVLGKVFFPFSMPNDNFEVTTYFTEILYKLHQEKKEVFDEFIEEIIRTDFLKNLQSDCLKIYPEILSAELPFRPALFLDIDEKYEKPLVAFRVSTDDFQTYKDLYKDISEVLSRQLVLVAGINNILLRGHFNSFKTKKTPKNLDEFADVSFGSKAAYLDDSWYTIDTDTLDNQLRNSIAHYKTEYDDITQLITYYPKREGMKREKPETLYFLDFMRKILLSYREMHRLHHLIKCLLNYYYICYEPNR